MGGLVVEALLLLVDGRNTDTYPVQLEVPLGYSSCAFCCACVTRSRNAWRCAVVIPCSGEAKKIAAGLGLAGFLLVVGADGLEGFIDRCLRGCRVHRRAEHVGGSGLVEHSQDVANHAGDRLGTAGTGRDGLGQQAALWAGVASQHIRLSGHFLQGLPAALGAGDALHCLGEVVGDNLGPLRRVLAQLGHAHGVVDQGGSDVTAVRVHFAGGRIQQPLVVVAVGEDGRRHPLAVGIIPLPVPAHIAVALVLADGRQERLEESVVLARQYVAPLRDVEQIQHVVGQLARVGAGILGGTVRHLGVGVGVHHEVTQLVVGHGGDPLAHQYGLLHGADHGRVDPEVGRIGLDVAAVSVGVTALVSLPQPDRATVSTLDNAVTHNRRAPVGLRAGGQACPVRRGGDLPHLYPIGLLAAVARLQLLRVVVVEIALKVVRRHQIGSLHHPVLHLDALPLGGGDRHPLTLW